MHILTHWIPKSERGRQVARTLRERGYDVKTKDVIGRYVSNLPCASELTRQDLRAIAYDIAPEIAAGDEEEAYQHAKAIRDNPHRYGISTKDAEREAERIEQSWMIGG